MSSLIAHSIPAIALYFLPSELAIGQETLEADKGLSVLADLSSVGTGYEVLSNLVHKEKLSSVLVEF